MMGNKKTVNKLALAKKPVSNRLETTKKKSNSSLSSIGPKKINITKQQKSYSISAIALEIEEQFKQQLENKSISAIAPKISEQYKLKQEKYFNDLRNQLKSDLHEHKKFMLSDAANPLKTKTIASAQDSVKALLEKNSLKNAISESIDLLRAGDLYDAIKENDHLRVAEITGSYNPVFPLLKNLIIWTTMSQEGLIAVLKKGKEEFDLLHKKNNERTKKAIETRKATSKKNEILEWFLKKENAKCNLNSPGITSEAVQKFRVTRQHVNKLKSNYLLSKKK